MFPAAALLSTLLLSLAVAANPIVVRNSPTVRLSIVKYINETSAKNMLASDQARAAASAGRGGKKGRRAASDDVPATNQVTSYVASVQVGNQESPFSILIDSGSSNTWVGANQKYSSTTGKSTGQTVEVVYGSGEFEGKEVVDSLDLGGGLTINSQSLGVASRAEGFQNFDGILGIGPVGLTQNTLSPNSQATIPTVTDNLFSQGSIPENLVAVSFEPATSTSSVNGELAFGGTDSSKFTGSINFVPLTSTSPANEFWGIDQSITYGNDNTPILDSTAGIVDTGTTLLLLATDALERYMQATGAVQDERTGLLKLTNSQFSNLQSLNFNIGSNTFEFTANAQAWPRSLNAAMGGNPDDVYLVVNDIGSPSGQGLDFINGQAFLERFYSVFDTGNSQFGIATTPFTTATTN